MPCWITAGRASGQLIDGESTFEGNGHPYPAWSHHSGSRQTFPAFGPPGVGSHVDLAPLVAAICQAKRAAEPDPRFLALHDAVETVFVPLRIAPVIRYAVRGLLDSTLHDHQPHECVRLGVHLWRARGCGSPGFLLIADGRRVPAKPPVAEPADVAGIRFALAAEGIRLDRERCAGTVWRITLPKFAPFEGEFP